MPTLKVGAAICMNMAGAEKFKGTKFPNRIFSEAIDCAPVLMVREDFLTFLYVILWSIDFGVSILHSEVENSSYYALVVKNRGLICMYTGANNIKML